MRNLWIGLIVVLAAVILGVAAAWGALALHQNRVGALTGDVDAAPGLCAACGVTSPASGPDFKSGNCYRSPSRWNEAQPTRPGNPPRRGWGMPGPMMRPWNDPVGQPGSERISLDGAVSLAASYIEGLRDSDNLKVAEVMEFQQNFYVVIVEKDSGRGAFELLVDPFSGAVSSEPGPNMMWNQKYGHMRRGEPDGRNLVSLAQAKEKAQAALGNRLPGAEIEGEGLEFYGYYTFDYEVDGQIAGMLSVNGTTGSVWFHTWHGEFIAEKEL